jgi:hypothetical protein
MKKIITRIYHPDGTLAKDISDIASFDGFTKEINSGLGEAIVKLAVKFDYDGGEIQLGNYLNIYVSDEDTINISDGYVIIYSGYISMIEPYVNGSDESISIHALGEYTKLGLDILKNGANTTLYTDSAAGLTTTADGDAADVGLIARGIIDRFRAENADAKISYSELSIPLTATTVQYMFQNKTYRNAIDKIVGMAPAGYFFYVDEVGLLSLKSKPTTPTHTFEFGKHFSGMRGEKTIESLRNGIIIWNGEPPGADSFYKAYDDATSIAQFGRRIERYVDSGINNYAVAGDISGDAIAASFLELMKRPEIKIYCTIFDNNFDSGVDGITGYDIESIQPGDTCNFVGFDNDKLDLVRENMLITRVEYAIDRVNLTIEAEKTGFADWQEKTKKEVDQVQTDGTPETYTT